MHKTLPLIALLCLAAPAGAEVQVSLAPGDALTVEGIQLRCGAQAPEAGALALLPGSAARYAQRLITCGAQGRARPASQPATLERRSSVNLACVDQLYRRIKGKPTRMGVIKWARACRNTPIRAMGACKVLSRHKNQACFNALERKLTERFGILEREAHAACSDAVLECPRVKAVRSEVNLECLKQQNQAARGKPTAAQAIKWAREVCRPARPAGCKATAGAHRSACVDQIYRLIPGSLTEAEAAQAAQACKAYNLICPAG